MEVYLEVKDNLLTPETVHTILKELYGTSAKIISLEQNNELVKEQTKEFGDEIYKIEIRVKKLEDKAEILENSKNRTNKLVVALIAGIPSFLSSVAAVIGTLIAMRGC